MSRLLLQSRRTLLVLHHQTTVENEVGLFSKLLNKCTFLVKKEKSEVAEEEEQKRS
ncbi:uncharacterized protein Dana_GF10878 [Drosophila ananassae]|uniref:Uncharacterized protein n=1 Tax=Drosophila ananassae TaxID=7217 RepID=B3M9F1_DROAN|nr:uncharacterized protein LOC6493745 [Drosophila ananassae]EDV41164.1 uncharacterized protein Dana_GF10878 [Drosophila ananassae]KAH8318575.1 hypothetical protein KR067_012254 [Drosophila pandora]KAH8342575.1 hypothetical protein KR067_002175 [Drosophila pandora]